MRKKRCRVDVVSISSKKAQVTVFIILGIILLLALVLVLSLQTEIFKFKPGEVVPTEKGKIETFITSCIQKVGDDALFLIGLQGGYIEVPQRIAGDGSKHLKISPMNVVPFWAYGENTDIPALDEIKQRLDLHLEKEVQNCLFELEVFQETYDIIEKSPIRADTKITDSKVIFNVHWDLEVRDKDGGIISQVVNHVANSPIKLKRVYETAKRITETEMKEMKLEDLTQDLISLEHPGVPVAGFEVSCTEKKWQVNQVKEKLKDMLRINLRELKVTGTDYVAFPEELEYYQNHYIWDLGEDFQVEDVNTLFYFDNNYPFSFDVTPRSGAYMKSNSMGGSNELLKFFCMQSWKFVYSVSYPVMVVVEDKSTGYRFKMGMTVHLNLNYPDRSEQSFDRRSFLHETASDEDFCRERRIPTIINTYELVDNQDDEYYPDEPLEDVDVSFTCLRYTCDLGKSDYHFAKYGDVATFRENLPYCVGGIVRGKKEGYKEDWERLVTVENAEVNLNLVPLIDIPFSKIKVVKHEFVDKENIGPAEPISSSDTVLVKMDFGVNKKFPNEPAHKIDIIKTKSLDSILLEEQKAQFLAKADFTYKVDVTVMREEDIIGGYKGNWTVPWDQLSNTNEIVFHIASSEGSEEEVFDMMANIEENSKLIPLPEIR